MSKRSSFFKRHSYLVLINSGHFTVLSNTAMFLSRGTRFTNWNNENSFSIITFSRVNQLANHTNHFIYTNDFEPWLKIEKVVVRPPISIFRQTDRQFDISFQLSQWRGRALSDGCMSDWVCGASEMKIRCHLTFTQPRITFHIIKTGVSQTSNNISTPVGLRGRSLS